MTNQEIKLRLAEVALSNDVGIDTVKKFYDWVIAEPVEGQQGDKNYDEIPISEVIGHIRACKDSVGYATRLDGICKKNGIETVGDLIRIRFEGFKKMRHVGRGLMWRVQETLEELYGVNFV